MKDYVVISESDINALQKAVRKLLAEGWILAGGVSTVYQHAHEEHVHGHVLYSQALTK